MDRIQSNKKEKVIKEKAYKLDLGIKKQFSIYTTKEKQNYFSGIKNRDINKVKETPCKCHIMGLCPKCAFLNLFEKFNGHSLY